MAPQIKFNSFGIPYLVEFANVRFRSPARSGTTPRLAEPWLTLRRTGSNSTDATLTTASSETLASPVEIESGQGLYIQFASHPKDAPHRLSESRLMRLKARIAKAVLAAGMSSSSPPALANPLDRKAALRCSDSSVQSTGSVDVPPHGSFFRGTYGQVMSALTAVGLTTTPCKASGVEAATRLGALFVANHTESGSLELTKLTLWA
ncbi:hypothetical protein B0H21DRAFT_363889 [Amylocystis lapponica]|nr:hypothetical protein B0H21DRAFT_363889 [Amylocystis lapponica]